MCSKSKLIICLIFFLSFLSAGAQNKYAVLVGINQYYSKPGVPHYKVLQGCVNDAMAMKALLINRFGFAENGITTLTDAAATKENVLAALLEVVAKSKAGDAVVFYFSGHGVWMSNVDQSPLERKVKDGMNQAMVMSNLYADNLGCLFTDALVKKTFNKFVDKKVILTSIFDCCFSGDMPMSISPFGKNVYDYGQNFYGEKSLDFNEVYETYDAFYHENPSEQKESLNDVLAKELFDSDTTKAFDMSANITISDNQVITRPSERPGSMFLSLSATNEREKGLEAKDETGTYHGVFTTALLHVIKNNPSDMPAAELMRKIREEMKAQFYLQGPVFHYDNQRINKNFIGIEANNFSNNFSARCTGVKANIVTLDAGTIGGLASGNMIATKYGSQTVTAEITSATNDLAQAIVKKGNAALVKKGDVFLVTNNYTRSSPRLNVFIEGSNITSKAFNDIVQQKVLPLTKLNGYMDYEKWSNLADSKNIFYNMPVTNPEQTATGLLNGSIKDNFFVFLPIPDYIANALIKQLRTNQDIHITNNKSEAELCLSLNYIPERGDSKKGFVFTYSTIKNEPVNNMSFRFSDKNIKVADINVTGSKLTKLTNDLYRLATLMVRAKSGQWLNTHPRR